MLELSFGGTLVCVLYIFKISDMMILIDTRDEQIHLYCYLENL
jgi:hypothetical protein